MLFKISRAWCFTREGWHGSHSQESAQTSGFILFSWWEILFMSQLTSSPPHAPHQLPVWPLHLRWTHLLSYPVWQVQRGIKKWCPQSRKGIDCIQNQGHSSKWQTVLKNWDNLSFNIQKLTRGRGRSLFKHLTSALIRRNSLGVNVGLMRSSYYPCLLMGFVG